MTLCMGTFHHEYDEVWPELFERLSKDWSTLPNFQRTRGVLRLMADVVSVLWQQRTRDALILPARVPLAEPRIKASITYPLNPAFSAVLDSVVDGDGSLTAGHRGMEVPGGAQAGTNDVRGRFKEVILSMRCAKHSPRP